MMTADFNQQRCWNHASREAVCRCPECRRPFCRECVSEHEFRLLCAACIQNSVVTPATSHARRRYVLTGMLMLGTSLLAWTMFFSLGKMLMESIRLVEKYEWPER